MSLDDVFDILILVLAIAILSPIMLKSAVPLFNGEVGGFETTITKTEQKTDTEKLTEKDTISKDDLLLMVVIADNIASRPNILQLAIDKNNNLKYENSINANNDEISYEISYRDIIEKKQQVLDTINRYIPDGAELKMCTLVGDGGIEKWVVYRK